MNKTLMNKPSREEIINDFRLSEKILFIEKINKEYIYRMEEYINYLQNKIMNKETNQRIKKMENFLKEAFCIDGGCTYIDDVKVDIKSKTIHGAIFELCDSERDTFYVTISK